MEPTPHAFSHTAFTISLRSENSSLRPSLSLWPASGDLVLEAADREEAT